MYWSGWARSLVALLWDLEMCRREGWRNTGHTRSRSGWICWWIVIRRMIFSKRHGQNFWGKSWRQHRMRTSRGFVDWTANGGHIEERFRKRWLRRCLIVVLVEWMGFVWSSNFSVVIWKVSAAWKQIILAFIALSTLPRTPLSDCAPIPKEVKHTRANHLLRRVEYKPCVGFVLAIRWRWEHFAFFLV